MGLGYYKYARHSTSGFSLVELVIVIVIIGIVAAIAVPRISKSATKADESALVANLKIIRHAIDKYAAEHNGKRAVRERPIDDARLA